MKKLCYTLACTVNAVGDKIAPVLIAKGKSRRCLDKYNLDSAQVNACFNAQRDTSMFLYSN